MQLTSIAVVALPTGEADTIAGVAAAIVAEAVVSRPAQVLATLAVIVRYAHHPVFVLHQRVRTLMLVQSPFWPDIQPPLRSQSRD